MKVIVRRKPVEAATHYDILFAVQKMQEYSGSTDVVASVLEIYFRCMLKNTEPSISFGDSHRIAETFFELCRLFYVQNYVSTNPQTEFYVPQEAWKDYNGLKEENLSCLKEFGCIDYEDRVRVLTLDKTDTPSKIRIYKINNKTLSLQIKFAEKIYDRRNFDNVEYSQQF